MIPTIEDLAHPLAAGYDVRIDNTLWQSAPNSDGPTLVTPEPRERSPVVAPENPEDVAVREEEVSWSRTSWAGGEGLSIAHRRDGTESDFSRFWRSRRLLIEPANTHAAGQFETLTLLRETTILDTFPSATGGVRAVALDGSVYFTTGTENITVHDDDGTESSEDPGPSSDVVTALTRLGRELYASAGSTDGIRRRAEGGGWSAYLTTFEASHLWGVKRRLLGAGTGADANKLYEVTDSAATAVLTLPVGESFVNVVDGGSHILAAATDGYVYALGEESGNLVLESETRIEGEIISTLAVSQGVIFVGTYHGTAAGGRIGRLWQTDIAETGQLGNRQLVRTFGDPTTDNDCAPYAGLGYQGDFFVWVHDRVWRLHLETGGLVSYLEAEQGSASTITLLSDKFLVAMTDTGGLAKAYLEQDTYETEGWLISPNIDFFTDRPKHWTALGLFHAALTSNQQVSLWYSTDPAAIDDPDHPSWTLAVNRAGPSQAIDDEISLTRVRSRWLALKVQLQGAGLSTPAVRALSARARETAGDFRVQVTLNVSDWVDSPWRMRRRVPGLGRARWSTLLGYADQDVELELIAENWAIRGPVRIINPPLNARALRGSSSVEAQIVVEGVELSTVVGTNDANAMGIQPLGIPTLGGVES